MATLLNYHTSEYDLVNHTPNVSYNTIGTQAFRDENIIAPRLIKPTGFDWGLFSGIGGPGTGGPVLSGEGQIFPLGQYFVVNDMKVYVTEIDFGPTPTYDKSFVITDAAVATTNFVLPVQAGIVATGRQLDEDEMDKLQMVAEVGTGQFTLKVHSTTGPVAGKYKIGYQIGVL
jgi:hypothetical protein